jgi:hypothetical protein
MAGELATCTGEIFFCPAVVPVHYGPDPVLRAHDQDNEKDNKYYDMHDRI